MDQLVFQIADTRFLLSCNYEPFNMWLKDKHSGFILCGEPDMKIGLNLDGIPPARSSGDFLTMLPAETSNQRHDLKFSVTSSNPAFFFNLMFQICLRCAIGAKTPPDLLIHSSGIVNHGIAYIFAGESGAGKSTVCKLLASEPSFTVLHDEAIALSTMANGFRAWSTPFKGEAAGRSLNSAGLRAVFFLKQDQTNYARKLSGRRVAELLCYNLITPLVADGRTLKTEQAPSLRQLLNLAELVPGYELHFRQERSFWDCISRLFESEPENPEPLTIGENKWNTKVI